eukprot:1769119-Rhodomonas_salina.1
MGVCFCSTIAARAMAMLLVSERVGRMPSARGEDSEVAEREGQRQIVGVVLRVLSEAVLERGRPREVRALREEGERERKRGRQRWRERERWRETQRPRERQRQ